MSLTHSHARSTMHTRMYVRKYAHTHAHSHRHARLETGRRMHVSYEEEEDTCANRKTDASAREYNREQSRGWAVS